MPDVTVFFMGPWGPRSTTPVVITDEHTIAEIIDIAIDLAERIVDGAQIVDVLQQAGRLPLKEEGAGPY